MDILHGTEEERVVLTAEALKSLGKLSGFRILAGDDEAGKVDDFYFDDQTWKVRYMVVSTGGLLSKKKLLLSPEGIARTDWQDKAIMMNLKKWQIEESPPWTADRPVSRQYQTNLYQYYGWGIPYWITTPSPTIQQEGARIKIAPEPGDEADPHLMSAHEVKGYDIHASNGDIGHIEDFLFEEKDWVIRYLRIDTRKWLKSKSAIISPGWVREISWPGRKVFVDLTREAIKSSPEYDPSAALDRDYEERLYAHYGKKPYWQ